MTSKVRFKLKYSLTNLLFDYKTEIKANMDGRYLRVLLKYLSKMC